MIILRSWELGLVMILRLIWEASCVKRIIDVLTVVINNNLSLANIEIIAS
jgi:hypothetical protein